MKFKCPECGKPLKVADERAGSRGRCPACKAMVVAPQPYPPAQQVLLQEIPDPPPLPMPDQTFEVVRETRQREKWRLSLYGDRLILHSLETGAVVEVLRDQAMEKIRTSKFFFIPPLLLVKDMKKFNYRISPEAYEMINEWIGKPLLLKSILKQRLSWCIPIGIIYILTSLPLSGDPEAGLEAIPFDPISMGLGIVLVGISIASRKRPHPAFFLADSVWFFVLLMYTLFQIHAGASIYWGGIILVQIICIMSGINYYKSFSNVRVT